MNTFGGRPRETVGRPTNVKMTINKGNKQNGTSIKNPHQIDGF
jgi:hypothetical protein